MNDKRRLAEAVTQKALEAKWLDFQKKVAKRLRERGHEVETAAPVTDAFSNDRIKSEGGTIIAIDGIKARFECTFERHDHDKWSIYQNYTGRLRYRIVLGLFGESSPSYPEPKRGFNIEDAVKRAMTMVDKKKEEQERNKRILEAAKKEKKDKMACLKELFELLGEEHDGKTEGACVSIGDVVLFFHPKNESEVKLNTTLTIGQAAALVEYFRSI